jgi:CheY-like chemotaxis protein
MRNVLVVDDEKPVADAIAAVLRKAGYTTLVAYDGTEALAVIERDDVDVVLTDLVMSGMDGATLLRWLRSTPETKDLPAILMSMLPEERVVALCTDYSRFLRKPLQFQLLFRTIEELCEPPERRALGFASGASDVMH